MHIAFLVWHRAAAGAAALSRLKSILPIRSLLSTAEVSRLAFFQRVKPGWKHLPLRLHLVDLRLCYCILPHANVKGLGQIAPADGLDNRLHTGLCRTHEPAINRIVDHAKHA